LRPIDNAGVKKLDAVVLIVDFNFLRRRNKSTIANDKALRRCLNRLVDRSVNAVAFLRVVFRQISNDEAISEGNTVCTLNT
jgi:hypothetical protein